MTTLERLVERVKKLPPTQQQELLDFAEYLEKKRGAGQRRNIRGLCADMKVQVSAEEIDEARQEMWGKLGEENQ